LRFETAPASQSASVTDSPPIRRSLPRPWRARIDAFDKAVDDALDHVRGNPIADRVFYLATELGDWALVWHIIGAARGLLDDEKADEAFRLSAILGGESLLVNGVIKSFFRRTRPAWDQPRAYRIRRPRSSSFPSGHASSAFTAAAVLAEDEALWPLVYAIAAVVATSRVYVRIHHASDVVGGVLVGAALGRIARRVWPKPGAGRNITAT
jgi:undecaprenyl-diphosphatase